MFSLILGKTYGFLVGRYYIGFDIRKKEEMDDLQDPIHIQ